MLIITLGGGVGGLTEFRSQLLASYGFSSLALTFFGTQGLPSELKEIPLESFEGVLNRFPQKKIALWGVSRGAELALILGSLFPEKIDAIAAYVPSSAIYGSLIDPNKPAWVYRNQLLAPNAPFPCTVEDLESLWIKRKPIALTPFFLKGMEDKAAFSASAIQVEKLKCPLLLISGEDDQMWPSTIFASQIQARLKEKNCSIPSSHYSYPGAGHFLTPFCDRVNIARIPPLDRFLFDFGGNPEDDRKASLDAWDKTVQFFQS